MDVFIISSVAVVGVIFLIYTLFKSRWPRKLSYSDTSIFVDNMEIKWEDIESVNVGGRKSLVMKIGNKYYTRPLSYDPSEFVANIEATDIFRLEDSGDSEEKSETLPRHYINKNLEGFRHRPNYWR